MRDTDIDQAIGVLTLVYRTPPDDARRRLCDAAQRNELTLEDLARSIVSVASGRPESGRLRDVIDREWDDLLL